MKLTIPLVFIFAICIMAEPSCATVINQCGFLNNTGYYSLARDLNASKSDLASCLYIGNADGWAYNLTLDLNNSRIINSNNSIVFAISLPDNSTNITIKNGVIEGFNYNDANSGINSYSIISDCHSNGCGNITIENIRIVNCHRGIMLENWTNANVQMAIDCGNYTDFGIWANGVKYSKFMMYSRHGEYGGAFQNINYSLITGYFEGTQGYYMEGWGSAQKESIGLRIDNSYNLTIQDLTADGLLHGIAFFGDYNYNNLLARISLPQTDVYSKGAGGIYLNTRTVNTTLCEIDGFIFDDCNQWFYFQECSGKNTVNYDSCSYVHFSTDFETQTGVSNVWLTPFFSYSFDYYPFLNIMFTPFFIFLVVEIFISYTIATATKNAKFGVYSLLMLVMIDSLLFLPVWFGLIYVVIIGYLLIKDLNLGDIKR